VIGEPFRVRTSDGITLAGHERGPAGAPAVVFVHGFPEDRTLWDLLIDDLAIDHRCIAYDVRGAGRSDVPASRSGWRMERLLADLDEVIDVVDDGHGVHLVGHDWGSIHGWAYVLHPTCRSRVRSFTSMSGPPLQAVRPFIARELRGGPSGWRRLARQATASLYIAGFQLPMAPWAWRRVLGPRWPALVRAQHGVTDASWPSATTGEDGARGVELYRAHRREMLPPYRPDRLPPVSVPTDVPVLLLVSDDDESVRPALVEGLGAFARNLERMHLLGGHWLARSEPAAVASAIRSHVAATD
jgi:pimeloyl-ACP methyl ester carboxylesterase